MNYNESMKKILVLLTLLSLVGCKTKEKTITEIYPEIINECVIKEKDKEDIEALLKNGTGVVFLSWSECPWCHSYINLVNESARLNELEVMYYDIYDDRDKNTDFYKFITSYIEDYVDEYAYETNGELKKAYDSNGKVRVYVPMVIYVSKGEIIGLDYQGSMEEDFDSNQESFWKENNRKDILISKLEEWSKQVSDIKKQIDDQGCDEACEIEEK